MSNKFKDSIVYTQPKELIRFIDLALEIERKTNPNVTTAWIKSRKCPYQYGFMPSPYITIQDENGNLIEICLCKEENRDCLACWEENAYELNNKNNGGTN